MPVIRLETIIRASQHRVFDLSRSVDLHQISTKQTNEKAVAGVTTGLINLGESVTWRARHFGIYQYLTSKITAFEAPYYFVDEQEKGIFKHFRHEHWFKAMDQQILMVDVFDYTAPLGWLGKIADGLFLEAYMRRFLLQRNDILKAVAESDRWQEVLKDPD